MRSRKYIPNSSSDSDRLLDVLRQINGAPDQPEKGWLTVDQLAERWNMSVTNARRIIRIGYLAGKVQRRMYRIKCIDKVLPVPHYKAK